MRESIRQILLSFVAVFMALLVGSPAWAQDKVVYHIDNAEMQATKGMRNIRNHLDVAPDTKIVVVAHSDGVDFLFQDAKAKTTPMWSTAPWSARSRRAECVLRCAKLL